MGKDLLSELDFDLYFNCAQIPDNGEDSGLRWFDPACPDAALAAVFDGCGGSGAKKYARVVLDGESYDNKTVAFLSSRIVSGAVRRWFEKRDHLRVSDLKKQILDELQEYKARFGEVNTLRGNISREFPTTMAAALFECNEKKTRFAALWAGDSRVYLLDENGLAQLTQDDLGGLDAMENLSADATLTNLISLDAPFEIHVFPPTILRKPAVVFAATDGCFGYLPTPMDFEHLLLDALMQADTPSAWETLLQERIRAVAGDDYTLSGFSLGFGSFQALRKALSKRAELVYTQFIQPMEGLTRVEKQAYWLRYRENYYRYFAELPEPEKMRPEPAPASEPVCPASASMPRPAPAAPIPGQPFPHPGVEMPAPAPRPVQENVPDAPAPEAQRTCPKCGNPILPDYLFCLRCGLPLVPDRPDLPMDVSGAAESFAAIAPDPQPAEVSPASAPVDPPAAPAPMPTAQPAASPEADPKKVTLYFAGDDDL